MRGLDVIHEFSRVLHLIRQARLSGSVGIPVERQALALKRSLCASQAFCHECLEQHRSDLLRAAGRVSPAELSELMQIIDTSSCAERSAAAHDDRAGLPGAVVAP
jgi:hypothetical protein